MPYGPGASPPAVSLIPPSSSTPGKRPCLPTRWASAFPPGPKLKTLFTAAFSADTLAAGATESSVLTVQPVAGLTAGTYSGNVTVQVNGVDFATYPVSLTVNAPAAASLAADPASGSTLAFDSVKEGYAAAPDAKSVTVSNSGNAAANLTAVLDEAGQNAFTAALSQASIAGGESAILAVQPKMGLKAGTYTGQVSV